MLKWMRQRRCCGWPFTELGDGIELVAEVEADRADRRLIAQARADRVAQIAEVHAPRVGPHVAAVEKQHGAQFAAQLRAQLLAERQHAVAADRQPRVAERADFVPPPSANAGRPAEKILLRERHVGRIVADRPDVAELQAAREHHLVANRKVLAPVNRQRVVVERAGHEAAGLLGVQRDLIAVMGVQHAVRRRMLQIEAQRVERSVLLAGRRVEAERDEVVAQRQIVEHAGAMVLLVACSFVSETAHDVCWLPRWVTVALAPVTID